MLTQNYQAQKSVSSEGNGSVWSRSLTSFGMTNLLSVIPSGSEESFLAKEFMRF
jgi:hypothetical protein